ncbi:MAG: IS3 family transposase [Gemmatimonadales bacterium]
MAEKRRSFRPEFKQEAVRLLAESGRPLTHIARELAIRPEQLREWRRRVAPMTPAPAPASLSEAEEVRRLRRELEVVRQERDFLKKGGGVLRERVPVKYACIARHRDEFTVALMCRVLRVSRAGFYAWLERPPSARATTDGRLRVAIRAIHAASQRSYGSPRVHRELRAQAVRCGRKRIVRLMQAEGLRAKRSRRYRGTTQADPTRPVAPNLLDRQFQVTRLDRVWVGDVTACWTTEGWLYVAVVLDLGSRRVVGWATSAAADQALTLGALRRALVVRQPAAGLLHHSDRGSHYTGADYRAALAAAGLTVSMSRKGDCWDNAVAESFFATLKTELVADAHWTTRAVATAAVGYYIEGWYNRRRRHSTLDYVSPVEYEQRLQVA